MYVPPPYRQHDRAEMHALMRAARLATLIVVADGAPLVSHVPMLLDADKGPHGTLLCHLARANAQARAIGAQTEATAVFVGPDAYISPSWYATKEEHGKVVPTWNYLAVHAVGPVRLIEDPVELRALVTRLTERHEAGSAMPWSVDDAPADYIDAQLRAIVGLEIPIARLDGAWKLGQSRSDPDAAGAIAALETSDDARDRAIANAMRASRTVR